MTIRLVDAGWGEELTAALSADNSELRVICPFIKAGALDRLLSLDPANIQVITRFNLLDFAEIVSDIESLRMLLDAGAQVRGIRNLHAKLYLFANRAIVTSANLTKAALDSNHEFGLVTDDALIVSKCRAYFDRLWQLGASNLSLEPVDGWEKAVNRHWAFGGRPSSKKGLGDFGADAGGTGLSPILIPPSVADASQAIIKLSGKSDDREPLSKATIDVIVGDGCHLAFAYPSLSGIS